MNMLLTLLNKFWLVVFFSSNIWRSDLTGDSVRIWHYINYPASYSEELINLCWYFWGGGLYPFRQFTGVKLVWNIDNRRPAVDCTVNYNWSDLLLDKNVISHQTNQFSLQYLHQQRKNWRSCFDSSILISTHKSAR